MMTSTQIRQSFLDFFKSKQHTIVQSSSLMPDSPNLLFTNAGMNQFVPIFLGQTKCPYTPGRAADTQKCIRAGGKHNDLDDVGLDTYHHTFFEMLGNWSFGDYFKREAIDWAWELIVNVWKFPPQRLYATVYNPDKSKNDPSEFDQEAWNFWAEKFRSVGLDPAIHIVNGNKKDNFWMMGETGPCGPCSELHVDLTPDGDTKGSLVNKGDARTIEIWNLVFIQFNANPDGTFSPLPAQHVDTGMGFERVTSIIQGTRNFTDFASARISNYETDIFRPIFDVLEKMSGKTYKSTLPSGQKEPNEAAASLPRPSGKVTEPSGNLPEPFGKVAERSGNLSEPFGNLHEASGKAPEPSGNLPESSGKVAEPSGNLPESSGKVAEPSGNLPESSGKVAEPSGNPAKWLENPAEPLKTSGEARGNIIEVEATLHGAHSSSPCDGEDDDFTAAPATAEQIQLDIAFRVIADHIRTLSFAIADGIQPGNTDRNYVLRRILRRAVRYGRTLGFHEPFFYKLVDVLADTMGDVFPEIRAHKKQVQETIRTEEEAFNKTLDKGIQLFEEYVTITKVPTIPVSPSERRGVLKEISGGFAFQLYDTFGFPLDLTELMARERGMTVDKNGFEKLMEEQRARARAAQKKEVISLSQIETTAPTKFVGFEKLESPARVLEVVSVKDKTAVVLDTSPFYAEMGGQVGDTGEISVGGNLWRISNTQKSGNTWLHFINDLGAAEEIVNRKSQIVNSSDLPTVNSQVTLTVDRNRRSAIQRHHTVTHLLHWALHEVASKEASQKGSFVGTDKLTFDFNSAPLTPAQVADIEKLVNERILENAGVSWTEVAHADVKHRKDVMQFFGDKYGDTVRVVQIGGHAGKLDGYSMELCGGTHARATGEIGLFRIVSEAAVAAGVRRIEAVAGLEAYRKANDELHLIKTLAGKVNSPVHELEKKIESLLTHQKELEREVRTAMMRNASNAASELLSRAHAVNGIPFIAHNLGEAEPEFLQAIADALKGRFQGVVVLGGHKVGAVTLICAVTPDFTAKIQAGKIIQTIAPIVGGKGGGKPDNARGGGKDFTKLDEALAKAKTLLG
jgi:alanine--tRNA ligase